MNDISAAIGVVQLAKLDAMNLKRAEMTNTYNEAFSKVNSIKIPNVKAYMSKPACHNYVIQVADRDGLNNFLKEKSVRC